MKAKPPRCFYCSVELVTFVNTRAQPIAPHNARTKDHIYSRASGRHERDPLNTVDCCRECNDYKGRLMPLDWLVIMPNVDGADRLAARLQKLGVDPFDIAMAKGRRRKHGGKR